MRSPPWYDATPYVRPIRDEIMVMPDKKPNITDGEKIREITDNICH